MIRDDMEKEDAFRGLCAIVCDFFQNHLMNYISNCNFEDNFSNIFRLEQIHLGL